MEERTNQTETEELRPGDEDTIALLHLHHDQIVNGKTSVSEKLLLEIRQDMKQLESYPLYQEYAEGRVPTIDVLAESMHRAVEKIDRYLETERTEGAEDEDLVEELKIKNLLSGRHSAIERGIQSYIRTIIQFHNIKRLAIGGVRDMTAQFQRVDRERRTAHDGLLASLRTMRQTTYAAAGNDLIKKSDIIEWTMGMNAKELLSHNPGAIIVFSDRVLQDRNYIRDWAIAADFEEQLKEIASYAPTA